MSNFLNLFGVPIYNHNIGVDLDKEIYQTLEFERVHDNGYITQDKQILNQPLFKDLKIKLQKQVDAYTRDILHIKDDVEFEIIASWVNKHEPNDWAQEHDHVNSLISGVYYIECPMNSGNIVFHKDKSFTNLFPRTLAFEYSEWVPWNCEAWSITPNEGDIILFPSTITHSVLANQSYSPRYSLAFNIFPRGKLGANLPTGKIDL